MGRRQVPRPAHCRESGIASLLVVDLESGDGLSDQPDARNIITKTTPSALWRIKRFIVPSMRHRESTAGQPVGDHGHQFDDVVVHRTMLYRTGMPIETRSRPRTGVEQDPTSKRGAAAIGQTTTEDGRGMFARFDRNDRRAAIVGALVLVTVALVYPLVADATARPLAGFVLPCLVTAVLGGWRPTLLVGITSLSVAIVVGLLGPLDIEALLARWIIIGVGVLIGAVGAAVRERQSGRFRGSQRDMSLRPRSSAPGRPRRSPPTATWPSPLSASRIETQPRRRLPRGGGARGPPPRRAHRRRLRPGPPRSVRNGATGRKENDALTASTIPPIGSMPSTHRSSVMGGSTRT